MTVGCRLRHMLDYLTPDTIVLSSAINCADNPTSIIETNISYSIGPKTPSLPYNDSPFNNCDIAFCFNVIILSFPFV